MGSFAVYERAKSEYYVYQMCEQWLLAQEQRTEDILSLIDDILSQIRFYQMTGSQLLMVEDSVLGSRYRTTVQQYLN